MNGTIHYIFYFHEREKWWDGGDGTVAGWQSIVIGATTGSEVAGGEGRPEHSERKKERKKRNGRREEEEEEKGEKMGRCDCGGKRWVLRRRRSKRGKNGKVWLWWEEMGFRVCF